MQPIRPLAQAATWLGVDWLAFVNVLVVSAVAATVVASLYGSGLRLWITADQRQRDDEATSTVALRTGAVVCFAVCVAAILYGLYLIIPFFH